MPEKPITDIHAESKAKNFCRTASIRMRRKVKHMSRALTFKKKSWDVCQNMETDKVTGATDVCNDHTMSSQYDETFTLIASLDEVYQSVLETSRDLAFAIDKLDRSSPRHSQGSLGVESTGNFPCNDTVTDIVDAKMKSSSITVPTYPEDLEDRYAQMDEQAIRISSCNYTSIADLVRDLTVNTENDLDKARSIFRWVVAVIENNTSSPDILHMYRTGQDSYHRLYQKLCRLTGLDCEIIVGWSKGAGYKPNMALNNEAFRNSWTAVSIGGEWRFVNCVWAARHLSSPENCIEMVHRFDEFYFLSDPNDHIFQHFPDDSKWQLLDVPLSIDNFIQLPVLKSAFFRHDLSFSRPCRSQLTTNSGEVEIRIRTPEIFGFGSVLSPCHEDSLPLENCVLQKVIEEEVVFRVNLPCPGQYYFSVYVGDYWQPRNLEIACSVQIDFTSESVWSGRLSLPFPPVQFYGPTPVMQTLGVTVDMSEPVIALKDNYHDVTFGISSDIHTTHTFQYFDSQSGSLVDMDNYAFLASRTSQCLRYLFACSRRGYYVFSMYATNDVTVPLDCVYRCLLFCESGNSNVQPYPVPHSNWKNCALHFPLHGSLKPNSICKFQLDISHADSVSVSVSDKICHLTRNSNCLWEGEVFIGESGSRVKVMGTFKNSNGGFTTSGLLDYEVTGLRETIV